MSYVNFREIKETITVEQAMIYLGLKMKAEDGAYRSECPTCKAGGNRALVITPEKSAFYCHTAKKGGDVISLVAHIHGTGMKEAAQFLLDRSAKAEVKKTVPQKNDKGTDTSVFQPLAHLHYDHERVKALGMDEETAQTMGIGYAAKGLLKGMVAVPVRLADGHLCGYIGITHDAKVPTTWHMPHTNVVPITKAKKRA